MRQQAWRLPSLVAFLVMLPPDSSRADVPPVPTIEFNRDIRPILANNCFSCHGPDSNLRKADLRLDRSEDALAPRDGNPVLVPGKPAESELFRRITSDQPSRRMPPPRSNHSLSAAQVELLRQWIEQGARYQPHWSFMAPRRPRLPPVQDTSWPRNPIDCFLLARLEQEGLRPSPEAERRTLARRLSLDLRGLPPTPEEVETFVNDDAPNAYERFVERLLASPHHAERLAIAWLDLVRFADTAGYYEDNHRDLALYRDYVIAAFNANLPFDHFTLEQLAGDLLPGTTKQQKIASGYNRLLQTTTQATDPKEYEAKYAADRVRNTATAWLGLTLGCCECHNHKFDPFTLRDFYRLEAFFADLQELAIGLQVETYFPNSTQEAQLAPIETALASVQKRRAGLEERQAHWEEAVRRSRRSWVVVLALGLCMAVLASTWSRTLWRWAPSFTATRATAVAVMAGLFVLNYTLIQVANRVPKEIVELLKIEAPRRDAKQQERVQAYFLARVAPELQRLKDWSRQTLAELERQKAEILKPVPRSLVSISGPPRTVRLLPRGNWLDQSGEVVEPGVPESLPQLDIKDRRPNRLDLARWLVAPENPLTARVFVNRLWQLFYGQGIVATQDNFGLQGSWPSHPELLDWLAVEFRDSGWDVRHLVRLLVTSSAYRQSSRPSEMLRQRDPYNLLLARQARFRLEAELVRDNALAISGLLSHKIGGPSVKPYQPDGYWLLNHTLPPYVADKGEDQYRRGLYTYWSRALLHPSLLAFDAPNRGDCVVERPRSNTPQQALVLLNDPTYLEAARALAERMLREAGQGEEDRIHFAFSRALARKAEPAEVQTLRGLYSYHLREFQADASAADALLGVGFHPLPADLPSCELAAWTSVARAILNLHETITRD